MLGAYRWLPQHQLAVIAEFDACEMARPMFKMIAWAGGCVLVVVCIGIALLNTLKRRIREQLNKLLQGTAVISQGDYSYRIANSLGVTYYAEFNLIYQAFDNLASTLAKQSEFQQTIQEISERFLISEYQETDAEFVAALGSIGQYVGTERAFLFTLDQEGNFAHLSHLWLDDGGYSCYQRPADLKLKEYPFWFEALLSGKEICFSSPMDIPALALKERELADDRDIFAMLCVPLLFRGNLLGFVGLSSAKRKVWTENAKALLKVASKTFTHAIVLQRTYEDLRCSEQRNCALLAALPDMMFRLTRDGVIRYAKVNDWAVMCLQPEEYVGKRLTDVFPHNLAIKLTACIDTAIKNGKVETIEYDIHSCEREYREEARIVAAGDEILLILRNVTKQRLAEKKMAKAKETLDKAQWIATVGVMTASIAHEINQPLHSIKLSASSMDLLGSKGLLPSREEMLAVFHEISQEAERISNIISALRRFARRDDGSFGPVDLNEVVKAAVVLTTLPGKHSNISIQTYLQPELRYACGCSVPLEQVVINLLQNAIQILEHSQQPVKEIQIITANGESRVILEVRDNGPGVPPAAFERIFDPLFSYRSDSDENMGLGLCIVQSIIHSYGGGITAYNQPGGGAVFSLWLPVYTPDVD